jgi:photosystem II stability/assembly factor-like uncharacterized protein
MNRVFAGFALVVSLLFATCITGQNFHYSAASGSSNFFDIVEEADSYFAQSGLLPEQLYSDNEFIRFKRWEWYWKARVNEDGTFPDLIEQNRVYQNLQHEAAQRDLQSPWVNINQTYGDGGYNGMGRATSIAFHPTNPEIYYVGAPIGGIWKTTDGGLTYSALGDSLPYVSVGNICINPLNPDIMYITIGDHNGWWNYGLGVYKSTDAGVTWQPTGNTSYFTNNVAYLRMVINPANPDELYVAQTNGLYRTLDGGTTWDVVHTGSHIDVALKPGVDGELYCATDDYWGSSEVYASWNHGDTWTQITDFNQTANYLQISASPGEQEYLGIKSSVNGVEDYYATYDGGTTVDFIDPLPDGGILFTSPVNSSKVYCGFMVTHQSVNGGLDWEQLTDWYYTGERAEVHADNRFVAYHPLTNEIYFCNDGGIYKFNEQTMEWTELTAGLIITQYYRIAVAQTDDLFMIGGTQDNGGRKRISADTWGPTNGGDGMEVAIDFEDEQTIYTTYIYGQLYRSDDQWQDDQYNEITPPGSGGGDWVTPYVLDPQDSHVIVAGYSDVYRSDDRGETWQQLSVDLTGDPERKLTAVAVAPTDQSTIYAGRGAMLYITHDAGETWDNELVVLGAGTATIASITVDPNDPNELWVTFNGYVNGKKVYHSTDAGITFSNASYGLPNVPVNAAVIDKQSENHDLYIGTDVGVFVLDEATQTWLYYGAGLPNTMVSDLEIQYNSRKLRIGTFGRGVWENDLYSQPFVSAVSSINNASNTFFHLAGNPVHDVLLLNVHNRVNAHGEFVVYDVQGRFVKSMQRTLHEGHYQVTMPVGDLSPGNYFIRYEAAGMSIESVRFVKR